MFVHTYANCEFFSAKAEAVCVTFFLFTSFLMKKSTFKIEQSSVINDEKSHLGCGKEWKEEYSRHGHLQPSVKNKLTWQWNYNNTEVVFSCYSSFLPNAKSRLGNFYFKLTRGVNRSVNGLSLVHSFCIILLYFVMSIDAHSVLWSLALQKKLT